MNIGPQRSGTRHVSELLYDQVPEDCSESLVEAFPSLLPIPLQVERRYAQISSAEVSSLLSQVSEELD